MDGFTQVCLGAAIGTVVLGPKIGARKAALLGGLIAETPDLDFFFPSDTVLDGFIDHRGPTHAIPMHLLATPVIGEALRFADKRLRGERWLCYGLVFAALSTHALLDGFTTYGTKLLWPFFTDPISWSSIFIIDPLYTLPLLFALIWSLATRQQSYEKPMPNRARRVAAVGLILSTAYLAWGLMAREVAQAKVHAALEAADFRHQRLMMVPMPFNSLLWRGLAIDRDSYANVYVSLLDGDAPAPVHIHERNMALAEGLPDRESYDKIAWFSRGFYKMQEVDGRIMARDLRMGVEPDYFFSFQVAERNGDGLSATPPIRYRIKRDWSGLDWMWRRIFDEGAVREESVALDSSQ